MFKGFLLMCALPLSSCAIGAAPDPSSLPPDATYDIASEYTILSDCTYRRLDQIWLHGPGGHAGDLRKTDLPSERTSRLVYWYQIVDQPAHEWQIDFHGVGKNTTLVTFHKAFGAAPWADTNLTSEIIPGILNDCSRN